MGVRAFASACDVADMSALAAARHLHWLRGSDRAARADAIKLPLA